MLSNNNSVNKSAASFTHCQSILQLDRDCFADKVQGMYMNYSLFYEIDYNDNR